MPTDTPAQAAARSSRRSSILLVLAVAALTSLAALGRPAITDSDEAFYAEAAREMVESGDYVTPRYNYAHRFQKPVLYYWGAALGFELAGVSEAAARLPSALSGLGLAVLAWAVGRRFFGEPAGRLAGLVLGTSVGLVTIARLALPDLPLAFFISLATWAGMRAALDGERLDTPWLLLSSAAMGAAFLTKGPVGIVVPLVVLGPLVLVERRVRVVLRPGLLALAVVVFAAICVPWYWVMYRVHGIEYLRGFFVGDNLERFATDRFNDPRPPWFYLPVVLAGMLPWSAFLLLWIVPAWRAMVRRARPEVAVVRLIAWAALPLLLFTASVGKQPRYILPSLLPLAVGIAASIDGRLRTRPTPGRTWTLCAVIASLLLAAAGAVLLQVPAELVGTAASRLVAGGVAVIVLAVASAAVAVWRPRHLPLALTAASVALFVALHVSVLAPTAPETVERVAARVRPLLGPGVRWTTHEVFVRNLVFYVGTPQSGPFDEAGLVAFLKSPQPVLALVSDRDLQRLEAAGLRLHRLDEWQYFNIAAVRWRHLFARNPGRSFRTVVLVSNRDMMRP